jgi:hypothetical protein
MRHYEIKFVGDLRQVSGFLRVLGFPLPIKLTTKEMMIRDKKREMNWFCSQLPVGVIFRCNHISISTLNDSCVEKQPRGSIHMKICVLGLFRT